MVKKVKDLFPEMSEFSKATSKLNEITEFVNITKAINETAQSPTIGNDVTMNWGVYGIYQGPARMQTLREFIRLYARVSEIRAPIQHVTSEVFRRGITWKPRFVVKCENCNTEYSETKELCEKCGSESLVKPDEKQKERFNLYLNDANIFDNSFEEILKAFNINLAVLDDGLLYVVKEYFSDDITGSVRSKVIEIRNMSPADIDFDLDAKGLPKNNHFICYLHRDEEISSLPGNCLQCGRKLVPAMYILHHRGKDVYLTDSEIIHASHLTPGELWGISPVFTIMDKAMTLIGMDSNMYNYFWNRKMPACYDEQTEVLTKDGWKYFKDIDYNSEFITIDDDKNLLYEKPNKVYEYDYNGKMYSVKNHYINLLVTPNHRMMVKKQSGSVGKFFTITAEEAKGKKLYHLRGGAKWNGENKDNFVLREGSHINGYVDEINLSYVDWAKFLGCWYSLGYIVNGNRVYLSTGKNKVYLDKVMEIISNIKLNWVNGDAKISACSKQLYDWLSLYKIDKVKLLDYIKLLPIDIQKIFVDTAVSFLQIDSKYNSKHRNELKRSVDNYVYNDIKEFNNNEKFILPTFNKEVYHPELIINMNSWLKFLGYYLSEGSVRKTCVTIAQTTPDKRIIIEKDLNELPFKWRVDKGGFHCDDVRLSNYVKQFGHSVDRFIPKEYLSLSKDQLRILFDAWVLGDVCCTSSIQLKDDLMEIAIKLGMACNYRIIDFPEHPSWHRMYYLEFSTKVLNAAVNTQRNDDEWIDYNGKVYCVEIPHGNLFIRRNGKSVWGKNSMIMVFTDDPESVRKAQKEMENKTRQDNNYIPMVAVSSRNQRGRVDMVRLFHTLQEMEYLPVRQEIRERIAEIWGVTPVWQASSDSGGGIGSQSQQLVVMSRVVEGYQRIYHEKVFPKILYAFGITDWILYLPQPEEKSEQTRIAFAQQRTAIASQLHNMGFNVEIRSSGSSVDDIDFIVSGKAMNPQQAMFGGTNPTGTDDIGGGESTPPIALSTDVDTQQRGWINQIISSGYTAPVIKYVNNEGNRVYFVMNGKDYVSSFDAIGKLIKIEEINIQRPVQTQPIRPKLIPKKPLDNDYFEEE